MHSVIHVITTLEMGGAEKQLLILASAQAKSGRRVRVCYLKGKPELESEFRARGIEVIHLLANKSFSSQLYLFRQIDCDANEIVHAHLPQAELLVALSEYRRKIVVSRHNAEPFWPNKPRLISNALSRFVSFRAEKVIAISNAVKDFVIERGEVGLGINVAVVYYGYEPEISTRAQRKSSLVFGTISRLTEQKDLPTMLEAFAIFAHKYPDASLQIVGEGTLKSQLEKQILRLGIQSNVKLMGRTSEISTFLDSLDVFLLTSRYEGFGMVLLEAISRSVPIIASNNNAVIEVLGKDSPSLFPISDIRELADKMVRLQDIDFKKVIISSNQNRLGEFSTRKMLQSLDSIYSSAVESR